MDTFIPERYASSVKERFKMSTQFLCTKTLLHLHLYMGSYSDSKKLPNGPMDTFNPERYAGLVKERYKISTQFLCTNITSLSFI